MPKPPLSLIAYGDIVFDDFILGNHLCRSHGRRADITADITIAVDGAAKLRGQPDAKRDPVTTSGTYDPLGKRSHQLLLTHATSETGTPSLRVSGGWGSTGCFPKLYCRGSAPLICSPNTPATASMPCTTGPTWPIMGAVDVSDLLAFVGAMRDTFSEMGVSPLYAS
jgi:hypothetical protein